MSPGSAQRFWDNDMHKNKDRTGSGWPVDVDQGRQLR